MKNDTIHVKNKKTGEHEEIKQYDIKFVDWGIQFFVDDEAAAYKAAYQYRNSKYGVMVDYAGGVDRWMVTLFNERAKAAGIDTGK